MNIKNILNGFLALLITGGILLFSDLENRKEKRLIMNNNSSNSLKKITSGKNFKLCLVHYIDNPATEDAEAGLRDELKRNGLIEGTDFTLKVFNAQGDVGTLNNISNVIAAENWDLVFVTSTPTIQTISKRITKIPIVFTLVGDPVKAGLGKSYEEHLPNLTGIATLSDFEGLISLLVEAMPGIKRIGTIFTPGEINSIIYKTNLENAAKKRGLTLVSVPANSATEVSDAALSLTTRGIEAFTQISDNLTASCGTTIIKTAYRAKLPYFGFVTQQVKDGAVAAVSRDYYTAGVDAISVALEVLNGKSPADIPFRLVSKSVTQFNKEACKVFGIVVPEKYRNLN